jgi:hypothetical protein
MSIEPDAYPDFDMPPLLKRGGSTPIKLVSDVIHSVQEENGVRRAIEKITTVDSARFGNVTGLELDE